MPGPPEAEVPEQRIFQDFFPRSNAGQRRIQQSKSRYAVGMLRRESVANHVTNVVGDELRLFDFQRVENARDIIPLRFLVVTARRM